MVENYLVVNEIKKYQTKNTIRECCMSYYSFMVQSKSVNDRKQTRVKPNSVLLFCFSVSFLSLCVVHWPGGYEGGESTSNAPPGKSGKIRRRQQSWLMQCCTPRQCWQCWQYQPCWQLVPTVDNWCQSFDNPSVWSAAQSHQDNAAHRCHYHKETSAETL